MSYYKTPRELLERTLVRDHAEKGDKSCICPPTGYSLDCTAHEGEDEHPAYNHKKHFPWGSAILIALFVAFLIFDAFYGGFHPLLFPGGCG